MGAAAAGGGGEGSKATQSGFSLTPLSTPPAPSKRRDPGDHLHSDERGRAVWVPKRGWGLPSPTEESPRHAGNRVAGARGTHTRTSPRTPPRPGQGTAAVSLATPSLPRPRLLSLTCLRVGGLFPNRCPRLPHLLHWTLCGRERGRQGCGQRPDPRPLSCFSARPKPKPRWAVGPEVVPRVFEELQAPPPWKGRLSGVPLVLPASRESMQPLTPAVRSSAITQPSGFSPAPAHGPARFSRLDPVGESAAPEHGQGAEQEEGGAHGSAAPSPLRPRRRRRPRWPLPALTSHCLCPEVPAGDGLGGSS